VLARKKNKNRGQAERDFLIGIKACRPGFGSFGERGVDVT
jgi:hypothetical protein